MFTESRPLSLGPVDGFSYRSVLILLKIAWCLTCPYCEADLEIVSRLDRMIFISWRPARVPNGISHQGREGRKEPELIPRCALRHERRDISEGRRLCLPVSQGLVTSRTSHGHQ